MVMIDRRLILRLAVVWLAFASTARIEAQDADGGDASGRADSAEKPGRLDAFFRAIDGSRVQRLFDELVGLDSGDVSRRPKVPEIGEPVFFDLTRPLGDRKYGNELNYLFNSSTRNAPGLQVIEYEYAFADWKAAEVDLSYYNGNLEILTPFYQRTLGVGRRRNWVHGYQVSPDLYLRSGFVGGSAVYAFGWKPDEESKFSTLTFLGANRMLIGGFHPTPFGGPRIAPEDRTFGSWRPTINVDLFYRFTEKFTLGLEADQFIQRGKAAEYLDFPFLTYKPGQHAFFQVGGGYYHFESRDQFTFFLHLNFVNPSDRKVLEDRGDAETEAEPGEADEPGPIRKRLGWLLGDR